MYKTVQEAVVFVKELKSAVKDVIDVEIVVAPAVHRGPRGRRGGAQLEHRRGGAGRLLGARGRVHRRGVARDDEGSGRGVRDRRPLRTAAAVRRDRRHRQPQDRGGDRRRADADRLHRRDARRTRAQRDVRRARSADQGRARSADGRADRRARHRLRTGVGDRDGTQRQRPRRPARRTPTFASGCGSGSAATRPIGAT